MNRHDGSSPRFGVNQYQVAPLLAVFDESGPLESPNHLPRGKRRKLRHEYLGGNGYPSLKRSPLFGNGLPVSKKTFKVQCNRFLDVALSFFQGLALSVTSRQQGDERHEAAFGSLF